jgi:hypothetical protein
MGRVPRINFACVDCGKIRVLYPSNTLNPRCKVCADFQRRIKITGDKFGRWRIVRLAKKASNGEQTYECVCECGNTGLVSQNHLRTGHSRSCGCLRDEVLAERSLTHGKTNSVEWMTFSSAKQRCNNPSNKAYGNYGGRGILFKLDSFDSFISEVGLRPSSEHYLDRINNDGHYEIGNIRWATRDVQNANKRPRRILSKRIENFSDKELLIETWRRTPEYGLEAC